MKTILLSLSAAALLSGAANETQSILSEVGKLRQKYEECRAGQSVIEGVDPKKYQQCTLHKADLERKVKGYQTRIAALEGELRNESAQLATLQKKSQALSQEIGQKKGVIKSLEQTLSSRDRAYREADARSKNLVSQLHTQKVSLQEREMLKNALLKSKEELALVQKELKGGSSSVLKIREELQTAQATIAQLKANALKGKPTVPTVTKPVEPTDKIHALQAQLNAANRTIAQLQNAPSKVQVHEKIVTKVVEPTEKLQSLQRELSAAQSAIAHLKAAGAKVVYKDRIVTQEKIVYKDRPVAQEKIVEKVVYKDRPVEKIVTKTVQSTEKIEALQRELASARSLISTLKNAPKVVVKEKIVEKVVYKDRPVVQEKIVEKVVYKDRPVIQEKVVEKVVYKDRPVEKVVYKEIQPPKQPAKTVLKAETVKGQPHKKAAPASLTAEEQKRRQADKVALEQERQKNAPKKGTSAAYRMNVNAPVYNAPNGRQVDTWEERRSFTAGNPSGGWVHITGYFVNRVWQATREDEHLWVKESDTIRR